VTSSSQLLAQGLLDTRRAQARMLKPKQLADAITILLHDAYPSPLSRREFISRVEVLISSGVAAPISAFLTAPLIEPRIELLTTEEVKAKSCSSKPKLEARQVTEALACQKRRAHEYDPTQYHIERANRVQLLKSKLDEEANQDCTFVPYNHAGATWEAAQRRMKRRASSAPRVGGGVVIPAAPAPAPALALVVPAEAPVVAVALHEQQENGVVVDPVFEAIGSREEQEAIKDNIPLPSPVRSEDETSNHSASAFFSNLLVTAHPQQQQQQQQQQQEPSPSDPAPTPKSIRGGNKKKKSEGGEDKR